MMRFRPLPPVALLTVAGLLVTGCTGPWPGAEQPASSAPPGSPPAAVVGELAQWRACPELLDELIGDIAPPGLIDQLTEQVSYECATVAVPQDWDVPESPAVFEIALVRARSTEQRDRIGSLLVNPGGPGASGVEAAVFLSLGPLLGGLPETITGRFDVVGFDPRGVARSSPVECFTDADLEEGFGSEPDPASRADFDAAVAEQRAQAEQCGAKYGAALSHFSTRQTAHDLEALRQAVGDQQLTYLGFSYGTLLGAVYAQLYPEQIRAMVLDGAVDPAQDIIDGSRGQAEGFERALDNFAQWCDQATECPLQPDARTAITEAIERARQSPAAGEGGREATAGWVFWSVISALYARQLWPQLAAAIDQLDGGDPSGVFELADGYARRNSDGSYTNMFDANAAVNCADDDTQITVEQVRDLQDEWREEYPLFGAPLATSVLGCVLWPAEPDPYPTGPAEGAPPIVVVGTLGDPATPYESTPRLAEMLGVGVVVTSEGEGHTAYPENSCIAEVVDAYLIDLTVPAEGTSCPA
jgi:pimeloyl-ACP methyl ester carboxylesterase